MFPAYGIPNVNALVCERDQDLEVDDHYRSSVLLLLLQFLQILLLDLISIVIMFSTMKVIELVTAT